MVYVVMKLDLEISNQILALHNNSNELILKLEA